MPWMIFNDSFLSIVADPVRKDELIVRARARGDIQRVFPGAKVVSIAGRDYAFRASLSREVVAAAISDRVLNTKETNFKDSTVEKDRHDAYFSVWGVMASFQEDRGHGYPYHTTKTGKAPKRGSRSARYQRRLPMAVADIGEDEYGDPVDRHGVLVGKPEGVDEFDEVAAYGNRGRYSGGY